MFQSGMVHTAKSSPGKYYETVHMHGSSQEMASL